MADPITLDNFMRIVEGQAKIAEKLDNFIDAQKSMKGEIDAIKADVAAIKQANSSYKAYVQGAIGLFTIIWTGFTLFVLPVIHKQLGLG